MSLYIGHLSSRIHRYELEHVFQRFGRCNVRLKDGYGFVVYDFPLNAEKALRALQGRRICGEPLTLTWSNKQPRPFKTFSRAGRAHEPRPAHVRDFVQDYDDRNGQRDYKTDFNQSPGDGRRVNSNELAREEATFHMDNIQECLREGEHSYREGLLNEGDNVEPNTVNDRWDGNCNDLLNINDGDHDMEFERYDPYKSYDRKDEDENLQTAYLGGSPATRLSREKISGELIREQTLNRSDIKPKQTCYKCGGLGHKMRNCPQKSARRRNITRFEYRHGDDINRRVRGEDDLERFKSTVKGKLQNDKGTVSIGQFKDDREAPSPGKNGKLMENGDSDVFKETGRVWRTDHGGRKRSSRRSRTPRRHSEKKARRRISTPLHSDCAASRSRSKSKSLKEVLQSGSRSRSGSVLSRAHSSSSDSRSSSASQYSRSRKSKSRAKSIPSKSLSVSPSKHSPSSPHVLQSNLKGTLNNCTVSESKEILVELRQLDEDDMLLSNGKHENGLAPANEGKTFSSCRMEDELEKNQHMPRDDKGKHLISGVGHEISNLDGQLFETGVSTYVGLSSQNFSKLRGSEDINVLTMEDMALPTNEQASETVHFHPNCSTNISLEEMHMVMKHYGLGFPDASDRHLSVEAYFGAARLWPWEIIYYRKLKKGPISFENYARRIAQNKEFGIVDKYIRSSCGWGESEHT